MAPNPEIDLFSGAVKNATSTSVWSTATYVIGLGAFSPHANRVPQDAGNANMLIRKAAIDQAELQHDGGLLNLTLPRLIRSGKHIHYPDAVVDHVAPLKPSETVGFSCHCTLDAQHESRMLRKQEKSTLRSVFSSMTRFVGHVIIVPRRVARLFRGTGYLHMTHFRCVSAINTGLAFVVLGADLKRTPKRS